MSGIASRKGLAELVGDLSTSPGAAQCITAHVQVPAREARTLAMPGWVDPRLVRALEAQGVTQLYRHQRLAVDACRSGQDVVVVTPTASGKTLCYNLPVVQSAVGRKQPKDRETQHMETR